MPRRSGKVAILTGAMMVILLVIANAETFKYDSHGKRDPFVPLIGQEKNTAASLKDITSVEDLKLEGIAIGAKGKATAIINSEIVTAGMKVGEIEIKNINKDSVKLSIGGKEYNLKLYEEGGQKGE